MVEEIAPIHREILPSFEAPVHGPLFLQNFRSMPMILCQNSCTQTLPKETVTLTNCHTSVNTVAIVESDT